MDDIEKRLCTLKYLSSARDIDAIVADALAAITALKSDLATVRHAARLNELALMGYRDRS